MPPRKRVGKPITNRTLTAQLARDLRKLIVLGHLAPGERLQELKLAETFEVSRSTVRESLRKLEAENLVVTHAHRGTHVAEIDESDAYEICELHALLEEHTIRQLSLPLAPNDAESLSHIAAQMATLRFPDEIDRFIDLDYEFHRTLVAATQRRHLLLVWSTTSSLLNVLLTLSLRYRELNAQITSARHQAIVDALVEGDRENALALIGDHYRSLIWHFHESEGEKRLATQTLETDAGLS